MFCLNGILLDLIGYTLLKKQKTMPIDCDWSNTTIWMLHVSLDAVSSHVLHVFHCVPATTRKVQSR